MGEENMMAKFPRQTHSSVNGGDFYEEYFMRLSLWEDEEKKLIDFVEKLSDWSFDYFKEK